MGRNSTDPRAVRRRNRQLAKRGKRLLALLAHAERLRASKRFTELDYAFVAVGVLAELDERAEDSVDRARFEGRSWCVPNWRVGSARAVDSRSLVRSLGPYLDAPVLIARHMPMVAGRTADGAGGWIADLATFRWTPEVTKRVADATRRTSVLHRALWAMESAPTRFRETYPTLFAGAVGLLGIILTKRCE